MTSQSLNTDKKRAGFTALFNFTARQFWTTTLLFTIILFFILPVPVMMTISERGVLDAKAITRLKEIFEQEWIEVIRYFVIIAVCAFGVVVSCARFAYLKNKVSIDFYHSLPVKRGRLFITQLAVGAISVAIPYAINIILTLIVFAANGLITDALIVQLIIMSAEAFVYSAFFFSLSTLVGMVSGLTAVQLTLTLVAVFIVPFAYLLCVAFIYIFNENMWSDYYLSTKFFEASSPALRLVINTDSLSIFEGAFLLLISVAMLFGAYAVYMKRKSERAGTPVVFTPLGEVIKYVLVFLGTLGGGLLFYAIMNDMFWTVFGMICGAVLVFMLVNTILQKTARSMFKGWKGLCIFGACAAVVFILLATNAFDINTKVPSPASTSRVEVNFNDIDGAMEFTDPEVIAALYTLYTESAHSRTYDYYSSSEAVPFDALFQSTSERLEIVFHPKFGIPVAKSVRIYNRHDFVDEYKTVLNSDEFKAQYAAAFDKIEDRGHLSVNLSRLMFAEDGTVYDHYTGNRYWDFDELAMGTARAKEFGLDLLVEANKTVDFDFFQQQTFGSIYVYEYNSSDILQIPLFASMTELQERYIENGILLTTQGELLENLASSIDSLHITKRVGDGTKTLVITDKDEILEILKAADNPFGSRYSPFTFRDTDYLVEYSLNITDGHNIDYYYDEYGNEQVVVEPKDTENVYTYKNSYDFGFLLGRVPDFVIEYFAD